MCIWYILKFKSLSCINTAVKMDVGPGLVISGWGRFGQFLVVLGRLPWGKCGKSRYNNMLIFGLVM